VTSPIKSRAQRNLVPARASRARATNPTYPRVGEPVEDIYSGTVTVVRTGVDVPMLVLRGEWLKAIGFPIGAKAFLSTDKRGDINAHAWASSGRDAFGS